MRRRRALAAEVEDGGDERLAEMPGPDVIDGNARGERILGIGDPFRERCAAAGAFLREWLQTTGVRLEVVLARLHRTDQRRVRLARICQGFLGDVDGGLGLLDR